ncbi:MAG: DUF3060 domain-containing protein [Myxococcota bacterium]|jgi:hypothetical protein
MMTWRMMILAALSSAVALAQVQVNSGGKSVKVNAAGTNVQVEGSDDDDEAPEQVDVTTGGGAVNVKSGNKGVEVKTGGGATTVTGSNGKSVTIQGAQGPAPTAADGKWVVTGQGRTEAHVCAANEDVDISGQGHVLTLTGPCRTVTVSGQGIEVTTDVAGSIVVSGVGNKVLWKAALTGKKPKLRVSGIGNSAAQLQAR